MQQRCHEVTADETADLVKIQRLFAIVMTVAMRAGDNGPSVAERATPCAAQGNVPDMGSGDDILTVHECFNLRTLTPARAPTPHAIVRRARPLGE